MLGSPKTNTPKELLRQYWGYEGFRPLQEEIIASVMAEKDVLAVMPTGAGKSLCFQIPALLQEGLCLVVSPLIALMKDQVAGLQRHGIDAAAIFTGITPRALAGIQERCQQGRCKLLYVSPERLQTAQFQRWLPTLRIQLLAVDEAHCISQWGHDFRPAYRKIATLRNLLPEVPILALTASATQRVQEDIQEQLQFRTQHVCYQQSFTRETLFYRVQQVEDIRHSLFNILQKVAGSAIVYAYSRRQTESVARWLQKKGLSADYYHAGLSTTSRGEKQDAWQHGKLRIIVATNAFGMGIDKPDVRLVVHISLPSTLEGYYQEAGRAGRDRKKAHAVLLYNATSIKTLQRTVEEAQPSMATLREVYQQVANYYQIAVGSHAGVTYPLQLEEMATYYQRHVGTLYRALQVLEHQGFLQLTPNRYAPSQLRIRWNSQQIYDFQTHHTAYTAFLQGLLRSNGGAFFGQWHPFSEHKLGRLLGMKPRMVKEILTQLERQGILSYKPQNDALRCTFLTPRYAAEALPLQEKLLAERQQVRRQKSQAVINYLQHQHRCRAQLLLSYFGEENDVRCGNCDDCLRRNTPQGLPSTQQHTQYQTAILAFLGQGPQPPQAILDHLSPQHPQQIIEVLRHMLDHGLLQYTEILTLQVVPTQ